MGKLTAKILRRSLLICVFFIQPAASADDEDNNNHSTMEEEKHVEHLLDQIERVLRDACDEPILSMLSMATNGGGGGEGIRVDVKNEPPMDITLLIRNPRFWIEFNRFCYDAEGKRPLWTESGYWKNAACDFLDRNYWRIADRIREALGPGSSDRVDIWVFNRSVDAIGGLDDDDDAAATDPIKITEIIKKAMDGVKLPGIWIKMVSNCRSLNQEWSEPKKAVCKGLHHHSLLDWMISLESTYSLTEKWHIKRLSGKYLRVMKRQVKIKELAAFKTLRKNETDLGKEVHMKLYDLIYYCRAIGPDEVTRQETEGPMQADRFAPAAAAADGSIATAAELATERLRRRRFVPVCNFLHRYESFIDQNYPNTLWYRTQEIVRKARLPRSIINRFMMKKKKSFKN